MNQDKALYEASKVFAPDYPRQSSGAWSMQEERYDLLKLNTALLKAQENEMPGYYSVYSFPRGHSNDGYIPKVNCIFIDLDVDGSEYDPKEGKTDFDAWRRDMSALLTRARMIANAIIEDGSQEHYRATLSGHKGLHLYLDFPKIEKGEQSFGQFKNGLKRYCEKVMDGLQTAAGGVNIEPWVDVDASDLGRLARHPNTINYGVKYDDETRWCVPITVEELSSLTVDRYLKLTQEPRWPDSINRTPSESAGSEVLQSIRKASGRSSSSHNGTSQFDSEAVENYNDTANEKIEHDDIKFLTSNKPCIQAFQERPDAFNHGNASHLMEISIIANLVEKNVPKDVIHEFFEKFEGYEKSTTDEQIDKIIGREYAEFNCTSIADRAPQFCLGSNCSVYNRSDDIQK